MNDIPLWIIELIENSSFNCSKCKHKLVHSDICGIGIYKNKKKSALGISVSCSKCKQLHKYDIQNMDLEELAYMILEGIEEYEEISEELDIDDLDDLDDSDELDDFFDSNKDDDVETPEEYYNKFAKKKAHRSKISEKEVEDFIKAMNDCSSYEQLLLKLGITPDEYNYKPGGKF